jgi:cyclic-di-GMP phosphodiesterase TipF (flagellum assembly factor)
MRFSAFFVSLCISIIAASCGVIAFLGFDLPAVESAAVGLTALSMLTAYNAVSGRARDRAAMAGQITDLSRGTADLARQVSEIGRRSLATEATVAQLAEKALATTEPLATEIDMLGTLVKQLAESVAAHEVALIGGATPAPMTLRSPLTGDDLPAPRGEAFVAPMPGGGLLAGLGVQQVVGVIRSALESNRVDLYLQPIVTLPQRKVRYYEAVTRLRTEEGGLLLPADYIAPAENGGLMPLVDNLMLFRSVQVVRRLTAKNREIGLFCNIAGATLSDPEFFPQFFEFLSANRALSNALVFEFPLRTLRAMGPLEHEALSQIATLGYRFSIDHVADLQINPRALADQGVRFVKVPAALLLNRNPAAAGDIHLSDFSSLLARHGIELIAERIENETSVVDLLDYGVRFGQGFLFGPPRPVRHDVLQGGIDAGVRLTAAPQPTAAAQAAATRLIETASPPAQAAAAPSSAEAIERKKAGLAQLARQLARRA